MKGTKPAGASIYAGWMTDEQRTVHYRLSGCLSGRRVADDEELLPPEEDIIKLKENGWSVIKIADFLQADKQYIKDVLKRRGPL